MPLSSSTPHNHNIFNKSPKLPQWFNININKSYIITSLKFKLWLKKLLMPPPLPPWDFMHLLSDSIHKIQVQLNIFTAMGLKGELAARALQTGVEDALLGNNSFLTWKIL
jgi:hypothetical protein